MADPAKKRWDSLLSTPPEKDGLGKKIPAPKVPDLPIHVPEIPVENGKASSEKPPVKPSKKNPKPKDPVQAAAKPNGSGSSKPAKRHKGAESSKDRSGAVEKTIDPRTGETSKNEAHPPTRLDPEVENHSESTTRRENPSVSGGDGLTRPPFFSKWFWMSLALGAVLAAGVWWWMGRHPKAAVYHPAITRTWKLAGPLVASPAVLGSGREAATVWISQHGVVTAIPHEKGVITSKPLGDSNGFDGPLSAVKNKTGTSAIVWGTRDGRLGRWTTDTNRIEALPPTIGAMQAQVLFTLLDRKPLWILADLRGSVMARSDRPENAPVWNRENLLALGDGFFATPILTAHSVLLVSRRGVVLALEIATGRTLWKTNLPGTFKASPAGAPSSHPTRMALANLEGDLYLLDTAQGHLVKSLKVEGGSVASPVHLDLEKKWVLATHTGALLQVTEDLSGVLKRQVLSPGDGFRASPVVVDGDHHGGRLVAAITGQGRLGLFDGETFAVVGDTLLFSGDVTATPLSGDFDGDGRTDLWVTLESGHVFLVGLFPQGARPGKPWSVHTATFAARAGTAGPFLR